MDFKCPECDFAFRDKGYGTYKCPECLTVIHAGMEVRAVERERSSSLIRDSKLVKARKHVPHPAGKYLCVGCGAEIVKGLSSFGSLYTTLRFISVERTKHTYNPTAGKAVATTVVRKVPVSGWKYGAICTECASDFRTLEHRDKAGNVWYESVVKLDEAPTQHSTLPGSDERVITTQPPRPKRGSGPEWPILHPNYKYFGKDSKPDETLHLPSYRKYGKPRK